MGRRRKPGKREPNGKLSRAPADVAARRKDGLDREEQDTIAVAIEARQRVFGLPATISRDQMAGSAVGRYCLQGTITRVQYDAAMLYLADCEAYSHAIGTPGIPRAVDLNRIGGKDNHENITKSKTAMARYDAMAKAVRAKQTEIGNMGNIFVALDAVIRRDVQLERLIGDLRIGLNALAKHYGVDGARAAA